MGNETAQEKATRLAKEKAKAEAKAEVDKATNSKRRIIHTIKKDSADVTSLLEEPPSKQLVCQLEVFIGSWRASMVELAEVDDILLSYVDTSQDADAVVKQEEEIMKDRDELRRSLNLAVAQTKAISDTLREPVSSVSSPARQSFGAAPMFDSGCTSIIRLNDIPLPKFDGTYANFPDWYNEFVSTVDRSDRYDDTQRLYLLKRCMIGKMENSLKDIGTDGQLYKPTLEGLHRTYFNRRRIIAEHFAAIVDLPPIKNNNIHESVDKVKRSMRGIKVAGINMVPASPLITFLVVRKLPDKLRLDWDTTNHDYSTYPTFDSLATFLINRSFAFESMSSPASTVPEKGSQPKSDGKSNGKGRVSNSGERKIVAAATSSQGPTSASGLSCINCKQSHFLDQCPSFLQKNVNDRFMLVKNNRLCLRCLKLGHSVAQCNRNVKCNLCNGSHHRLLHRDVTRNDTGTNQAQGTLGGTNQNGDTSPEPPKLTSVVSTCSLGAAKSVFLSTAVVNVQGPNGIEHGRIFIDQGSEMTLVTREFCQRAQLSMEKNRMPTKLIGITNDTIEVNHSVKCVLRSRFSDFSVAIEADVVEKVPYSVHKPNFKKAVEGLEYEFGESCDLPYDSVDILLGSEYAEFVLKDKRYFIDGLVLRESYFGYVISGSSQKCSFFGQKKSFCGMSNVELSEQFRQFVDLDEIPDSKREKVVEHELINEHFESTYSIDKETGRFVIRLPLKESANVLKGSFGKAVAILRKSEVRRSEVAQRAYERIFKEYLDLKHMSKLSEISESSGVFYMPHHIVSKGSGEEISHRIVFNASFVDASGTSLNSHFLQGPSIQPNLNVNIIRLRRHLFAFGADIFRMYRCILVRKDDRKFQRIVFRFKSDQEIEVFELNTLTNGIGPASFIAPKCLEKIASFVEENDKELAEVLKKDFYMDNVMTGEDSLDKLIDLQKRLHAILGKYGFPLRKYQSNSLGFLSSIEEDLIEPLKTRSLGSDEFVSVLGLLWYTETDEIGVDIRHDPLPSVITKRVMLSMISKTFDILGILTPIMIRAKILLQDLWIEGRMWDEEVSIELREEFEKFQADLFQLRLYSIPRCYFQNKSFSKVQLIGYCDASIRAACAVVYVRSIDHNGNIRVSFVCSKSRLKPIKLENIHRMELIAAVLLAKLINFLSLELCIDDIFCFSDSQVALSWIKIDPLKLKTFVSNRVVSINSLVNKDRWFHVEGKKNPADLGTRGISASRFVVCDEWKTGPSMLHDNEEFESCISSNFKPIDKVSELKKEEKVSCLIVDENHPILALLLRKSSLSNCVSILAHVFRFIQVVKRKVEEKKLVSAYVGCFIANLKIKVGMRKGIAIVKTVTVGVSDMKEKLDSLAVLEGTERDNAFDSIIRVSQREFFPKEYDRLSKGLPISNKSKLLSCEVFLDDKGIMRSRGRLVNSSFSYDTKFPIIIPVHSRMLQLMIENLHLEFFHANQSFLLNFIRSKFWVIGNLLRLIKKMIRECVVCVRMKAECRRQLMGDLPAERLMVGRPFTNVGIDLTGAFLLKCTNHRSVKNYKVYLAFFVCLVTRAVHIEIVSDLTTEELLNALIRFTSRRGLPRTIFSDNGTNFIGSINVLKCSKFSRFIGENRIQWKTIAPYSPHQGGIWEAAVKSGKSCLIRAVGNQRLTLGELHTIATQVEAILNARPIAYSKSNSFVEPLTPSHFLIGSAMFEVPIDENAAGVKIKQRYFLWRRIVDSFWVTWRHDYVNQLRNRVKWKESCLNLKIGDVVLVVSKNQGVFSWPLGIVENVFPDDRGLVRNVSIRLSGGEVKRSSVQNLVLLPIDRGNHTSETEIVK